MISFKLFLLQEDYTRRELEQKDWDELCDMAYGVHVGQIIKLKPSQIKIKYKDDLVNPQAIFDCEIKKNGKCGMDWVRSVSFDEPVKVSLGKDGYSTDEKIFLEDGHHRLFAAKKLKKPFIECEIETINLKAIEKLLKQNINEEFMTAFRHKEDTKEVFVNPTIKEIQSIDNYIRYVIDLENKKVYVWDGDYLIHSQMIRRLQREQYILRDLPTSSSEVEYIPTLDKYIQGHIDFSQHHESDLYNYMLLGHAMSKEAFQKCEDKFQTLYDMDMSWLNKYYGFSENDIKNMILKYLIICSKRLEAYRKFEED